MKFLLHVFTLILATSASGQGVLFVTDKNWSEIKDIAFRKQKLILIDAFTTWCIPCQIMSKKTFTDESVGNSINDKYIAVKVQMDKTDKDNTSLKFIRWD
jgi:thiol:disulfide interchange protein